MRSIKRFGPYLVSALLMGGLLWLMDWGRVSEMISPRGLPFLAMGAGFYALAMLIRGVQFRCLLWRFSGRRPAWPAAIDLSVIWNLSNQLLPMRTGEAVFVVLSRFGLAIPVGQAVAALVAVRLFDLISLLWVVAAALLISGLVTAWWWYLALGVIVVALLGAAIRLDLLAMVMHRVLGAIIRGLHWDRKRFGRRVLEMIEPLVQSLRVLREPTFIATHFSLSTASWLCVTACFQQFLLGFNQPVSYPLAIVGSVGAVLFALLPISMAGNFGTLEAGWVAGFVAVGLSVDSAIATGIASHALVILVSVLLASVSLGRTGRVMWHGLRQWRAERGIASAGVTATASGPPLRPDPADPGSA